MTKPATKKKIDHNTADQIIGDFAWRKEMRKTLTGFQILYLAHHLTEPPATFHHDLDDKLADHSARFLSIEGFRGSAKSTKADLALVLWAALENPERYPFIIVASDTQLQAKTLIANIREELENNEMLKNDYGTQAITEGANEWQKTDMTLGNGVRILARSRGQKVRGLKHRQHRPKLVIIDDPEDAEWARTKENRDKTERWLRQEVLPAIDERTGRCIAIGNLVHKDCLLARLANDQTFEHLRYPLIDENGKCTWPAKYPDQKALDRQRALAGNTAWQREYLLRAVAEEGAEVLDDWIQHYDTEPAEFEITAAGVDLAISKKETADSTAIVVGRLTRDKNGNPRIYIQPRPTNDKLNFRETINTAKTIHHQYNGNIIFFVEKVAYQAAAIEEMERELLSVEAVTPGTDKRARLRVIAPYIQNGTVLFPRTGAEDLILQLTGFGVEAHDDLVDAFVYCVRGLVDNAMSTPEVITL